MENEQAESALRESERMLGQLIGNLPGFVFRSFDSGQWTLGYLSEGFREITGYGPEQFTGIPHLSYNNLILEGHREAIRSKWEWAVAEHSVFEEEYPIRAASGETRWLWERGRGTYDREGRLLFVEGFVTDITERKLAEEALRESQKRNKALLDANPDMMFVFSADGRILDVKVDPADDLFVAPELFLGKPVGEVLPAPIASLTLDRIQEAQRTGRLVPFNYTLDLHGRQMDFESRLVPCGNGTFLAIVRDITERKRAEEERRRLQARLNQAQKMESLGSLAGGVAHDMNNVLGAILALATTYIETQPAGSPVQRAFGTIIKAAERGGKMLKGLLNFVRQTPAEERELDLNAILQDEVHLLERTTLAKVRLELDLAEGLPPIRGDAGDLANALMNLCLNAVDAMPEHGTLSLRTRCLGLDWIEVQVEDTGCGMAKEVLEQALNPFFTTKPEGKGTGLGLSMVYGTVKAHRGQMEIQSEPGQGTLVRMRFPVWEAGARVEPSAPEAGFRALSVLLVDDDELIRSSLQALLEALGHSARAMASGEDALLSLEAGLPADVVILDLNMPGLGGAGTLPRLRALRPELPVLLATGRADRTALDLVEAHPQVTLLSKPFTMKELQRQLEALG